MSALLDGTSSRIVGIWPLPENAWNKCALGRRSNLDERDNCPVGIGRSLCGACVRDCLPLMHRQ
eukprot:4247926-Prymnesium_polylepis.1